MIVKGVRRTQRDLIFVYRNKAIKQQQKAKNQDQSYSITMINCSWRPGIKKYNTKSKGTSEIRIEKSFFFSKILCLKWPKLEWSLKKSCYRCDSGDKEKQNLGMDKSSEFETRWMLEMKRICLWIKLTSPEWYYWFWLRSCFGRPQSVIWVEWLGQEPNWRDLRGENWNCAFNILINGISRNVFELEKM